LLVLALRTGGDFSQRQQFPKTAVLDTIFLADKVNTCHEIL
jgi:hypothetical protein